MSLGSRHTLSADGQTPWVLVTGPCHVSVTGTFGSGTAKVQAKDPAGNAVDIALATDTSAYDKRIDFPNGAENWVRVDLSSSTSPALIVWIQSADV